MTYERTNRARALRRDSTDAERAVWAVLQNRQLEGTKWRRQAPIGRYFADFACKDLKLIVELDGGQHADQQAYDENRTRVLEACGYRVLRFWNADVADSLDGVVETVAAEIALARNAPPSPSHSVAALPRGPLPLP